ncbi:transposase [uncultured Bacteroides sp.]|uniref:ISAon1 family transposase n=1 Tax=uncultured Bacteroides sp. TaxID=162156 RepID=UPI0025B493A7|nr:transposase [uncultured Bacteroides sp.]
MEKYPITARSLERYYHIDGDQFERQYKEYLSDYRMWNQLSHAENRLLFPENLGPYLSIDETSLSNGELYTIIINREAHDGKGAIVAIVKGTKADDIIAVVEQIPEEALQMVQEVTLDLSESMRKIVRRCFTSAIRVIDRFHIQKLACDAVQKIRIGHRWEAIQEETYARQEAKGLKKKYVSPTFENGDTRKELLARSRYLLFKSAEKWTESQKRRAAILFREYPDIKRAYSLSHSLRMIFNKGSIKAGARTNLAKWYQEVEQSGFDSFNTIAATLYDRSEEILNFYIHRASNAAAESFNAKIKQFRAQLRGVIDIPFFLYRLTKIYA